MELCSALLYIMAQKGISQQQLSRLSNINRSHLYKILHGKHQPSLNLLQRLANALGVKTWEIMYLAELLQILSDFVPMSHDSYAERVLR